jgi:hypothetical protein
MSLLTQLFFYYVSVQNFCLNYYGRFVRYMKDRARMYAGPPRQDYWLLNNDSNKGRVYSIMYDMPIQLVNQAFQFHIENNRIHKMNNNTSQYVRLPYITFEYQKDDLRIDLSDWIVSLRISQHELIDVKTLCELYCILNQRVFDYNGARINVITNQGAEMTHLLS